MTFLKKIGTILLKTTAVIAGVGPLFPQYEKYVGRTVDTLSSIIDIIIGVETFGQALNIPGPDKLKAASPVVANLILKSDLMIKKKIKDPIKFAAGCTKITDGVVDILNAIDESEVKEENIS